MSEKFSERAIARGKLFEFVTQMQWDDAIITRNISVGISIEYFQTSLIISKPSEKKKFPFNLEIERNLLKLLTVPQHTYMERSGEKNA